VTSRREPTLILWDIDQTLVSIGTLARRLYEVAFLEVTGQVLGELAEMAGRTERAILADTLELHGVPTTAETLDALYEALAIAAHDLREDIACEGFALPGASAALRALAGDCVVQSVVTGNLRPLAVLKLEAFNLASYIDFDIGGYGSDSSDRASLIRLAWQRANDKHGIRFRAGRIFVIGDTPHDVRAARAVGVRAVGVASGASSVEELREAGAHTVLPDLRDSAILRTIVGAGGTTQG